MANVRCPMCSKLNPPEVEVCSYCGARIKPLRGPQGGASPNNDEPDWLRDLRGDRPDAQSGGGAPNQASQGPAEDGDVPDWLSRIRDRARTETSSDSDLFQEDKAEEADWMQGLQQDASQGQPAEGGLSGLDDWLSRLPGGDAPQAAGQAAPPDQFNQAGDQPAADAGLGLDDWLRGLDEGGSAEPPTGAGSAPTPAFDLGTPGGAESGEDDWMSKLSTWQTGFSEEESKPEAFAPAPSQPEAEYDWLSSLGGESSPPADQPDQGTGSGTGLTSFLSDLENQSGAFPPAQEETPSVFSQEGGLAWDAPETPAEPEKPTSGFGLTGFLSQIEDEESPPGQTTPAGEMHEDVFTGWDQPAASAAADAQTGDSDIPAWMSGGPLTEPEEPAGQVGEMGVPDWLKGLESEPTAQAAETQQSAPGSLAEPTAADETGLPDWLRGSEAEPAADAEAVPPFESGLGGLPAWMSSDAEMPAQQEPQPFTNAEEQPQASQGDLPAWLLEDESAPIGGEPVPQAPAFTGPAEESLAADATMPDWLNSDFAPAEEAPAEQPSAENRSAEEALPDWFASFDQSEIEKTQPSRVTGGLKPPSGQMPPLTPPEPEPMQAVEPFGESDTPDWLRDFQGIPEEETGVPASPLLSSARALDATDSDQPFTVDLPDWLGEDQALPAPEAQMGEGRPSDRQQPPEAAGEQLAQAELPDWVRDMRPLESILPGEGDAPAAETDQRVEKAGPLAGMRGVLPVEELATRYRKPPVYSVKLHVTEKQRSQAALLDSILSQESQSLLIPPARAAGAGGLVRVLVALFLIIALGFPVVYEVGLLAAPMPERFPNETQMFEQINDNLQSSAPVLLAVEYEPGLSGEMRMASSAVVAQLVERNARIVLVSTTPAGAALGQQLLDDVAEDYEQRVNLGYLPGGTISLVGFASQPWWAAPVTLEGRPAWGSETFLSNVRSLSEFSQVIVLTDRAEVGRAWVEQVQPQLGDDVPLFMVASAQAAPLLQPYVESKQIAGMTSGMLGGAMYAQLAGQVNSRALLYLPAYQIGTVLAFVIVLVGGLVSAVMGLIKRGDRQEE